MRFFKSRKHYFFKLFLFIFLLAQTFFIFSQNNSKQYKYKGAEVYSNDSELFGKFEIRVKFVSEKGIISTFFLYENLSWKGTPNPWREIDIEILGREKDILQSNIITGYASNRTTSENEKQIENLSEDYHTYTIEWTPDYVAWYIDDQLIRKDTSDKNEQVIELRDLPQSYRMNLWITEWEDWAGAFKRKSLPIYQYINWIKYYEYTPGKGKNNFTLKWVDDFDNFDTARWSKGDWSFDGNLVLFNESNAVVKDGYLILCLTKANKPGFNGVLIKDE